MDISSEDGREQPNYLRFNILNQHEVMFRAINPNNDLAMKALIVYLKCVAMHHDHWARNIWVRYIKHQPCSDRVYAFTMNLVCSWALEDRVNKWASRNKTN